jgi:DNA polymerase-1
LNKYPDLNLNKTLCFDIETYDPELIKKGTGVYRKDGKILCVAVSNEDFENVYRIDHPGTNYEEKEKNLKYLTEVLSKPTEKLGTNILYDVDWLQNGYGIKVNGKLNDIQIAEPLLCEYADSYSLDTQAKQYLGIGKYKTEIDEFCLKNGLKGDSRQWLYKMPYELVSKYALPDVQLPLKIFELQKKELEKQNLLSLYDLEIRLLPLLLQMRKIGVRINVKEVDEKIEILYNKIKGTQDELDNLIGKKFNVKSPLDKKTFLEKIGIKYERKAPTEKMKEKGKTEGNPILDKEFLKTIDNPEVIKLLDISSYRTLLSTFFEGSFKGMNVNGRIHCNFNSLRSDEYGTVSGRLSSSLPNLQNIPNIKSKLGKFCREIFLPEEGYLWGKFDYSQIEYRLIAHYAEGDGADKIRKEYNTDPHTDYHQYIMNLTGLDRTPAKNMNFGLAYFMGVNSLSKKFGWSKEHAQEMIDIYFDKVPFLKETRNNVVNFLKVFIYRFLLI